ncbi:MAG: hypothetical protein OER12_07605 [Acidimicrobiia bacterium]|nr:hypothetical protein [Acidimicrobiia bacterium]
MSDQANTDEVAEEIRRHVEALFDAFLAKDRTTLREGRSDDWKGFMIPSTTLIRGADPYMVDLESALQNLEVTRYEFLKDGFRSGPTSAWSRTHPFRVDGGNSQQSTKRTTPTNCEP